MAASRILVGHDDSPHAADALALARVIAQASGAEIILGRIVPWEPLALSVTPIPTLTEHYERQEQLIAGQLQSVADREGLEAEAGPGASAGQGLHDLADDLNPDLVVIGSSHRGAVGQVLAGNVALRLLNGLDRPLAVAPAGYAGGSHRLATIGVGFDGTPEARAALAAAGDLARASEAEIEVIGVSLPHSELSPNPWAFAWGAGAMREDLDERMRGRVESAGHTLPPEIRRSEHVEIGWPADVLLRASEHLDLLVVGSRGYGPVRRLLLGSVSARIVREARCPVLVTPRPAVERQAAA